MTWEEFEQWLQCPPSARRPLVMGILNATPDSFSDGGRFSQVDAAVAHARQMVREGAELIDVGGESTRPGAARIDAEEQIRRVAPVIEGIRDLPAVVSIDTTRSTVARTALLAGAKIVNDVTGGLEDAAMLSTAAEAGAAMVLMHARGQPATMQSLAHYKDVVTEVREHLRIRRDAARAAGIPSHRILLDPGIGFAKTAQHDMELLRRLQELCGLGHPLLLGVSRKKFVGRITGEAEPRDRLCGTAATIGWCIANGANIVRVHDVEAMSKVVRMVRAIMESGEPRHDAGRAE